ncbi:hypothetical protein COCOBI_pt-0970 (chloroplast) [Coccomyxa sp. Obi]|nr:hypothetical protein COCOBI_pt-0970 [Coccomyxa sp. Obi]
MTRSHQFDDSELRRLAETILRTLNQTRTAVRDTRSEVIRRGQTISTTLDQVFPDITQTIEDEVRASTSQVEERIGTAQPAFRVEIRESGFQTGTSIKTSQAAIVGSIKTLEGLLAASQEFATATRFALLAAIGGVATETSALLFLAGRIEASVLAI